VSFGRTDASERVNNWQRSYLARIPSEDFGYFRKVTRSNHTEEDATWEKEDQLKAEFPEIFSNLSES
jgi:hypothetical protein